MQNGTRTLDVLLVDDEEIIHDTLGTYLSGCGMKVESAVY